MIKIDTSTWYTGMNRWRDQSRIAHVLKGSEVVSAACGAAVFSFGNGVSSAENAGYTECKKCRKIVDKYARNLG